MWAVVIAIQHDDMLARFDSEEEEHAFIESEIMEHNHLNVLAELIDSKTDIIVNGTGRFGRWATCRCWNHGP